MFKGFTIREQKQNELQWWYEQRMIDDKRNPEWSLKVHDSITNLEKELLEDVRQHGKTDDSVKHPPNKKERFRFSWKPVWRKIISLVRR